MEPIPEELDPLQTAIDLTQDAIRDEEKTKTILQTELARKRYENTWSSCCMTIDRRATTFFTQVFIIILILIFCIYQLITLTDCEPQQAYLGLLTLLIGILIPSPKFSKLN